MESLETLAVAFLVLVVIVGTIGVGLSVLFWILGDRG